MAMTRVVALESLDDCQCHSHSLNAPSQNEAVMI